MRHALSAPFFAVLLTAVAEIPPALAEDNVVLPASILMATSTGYWQDSATQLAGNVSSQTSAGVSTSPPSLPRHGYYKLYAVRQADKTSKVYLQQILSTDDGPQVMSTSELKDITGLKAFVTDIQPENSGGIIHEPGLFATLFIKRDIDGEAEAWNVSRDDLGEVTVEKVPAD